MSSFDVRKPVRKQSNVAENLNIQKNLDPEIDQSSLGKSPTVDNIDINQKPVLKIAKIDPGTSIIEPNFNKVSSNPDLSSRSSLDELHYRKPLRQHVKEFGQVLAIIGLLVAMYIALKHGSLANVGALTITSLVIVALCSYLPKLMLPVWRGWMAFGMFLGTIVTTIILGFVWLLMFIPIGFILKIFSIKVMDMSYKTSVSSYWLDVPPANANFKLLERQY